MPCHVVFHAMLRCCHATLLLMNAAASAPLLLRCHAADMLPRAAALMLLFAPRCRYYADAARHDDDF